MSIEVTSTGYDGKMHTENTMDSIWRMNRIVPSTIDTCVHTAISHKAFEHPEKTAISSWDGELTYRELDEISTQLALHLTELGVCAETLVPLCFEKSKWTPVAALGVLKAGGAFTLLDISTPEARLYAVVQQCRATVICASHSNQELCSRLAADVVIVSKEENQRRLMRASILTLPTPNPTWPMYVCFTSGSTGNPKGIVITHSSMYTALQNQLCLLEFNAESRTFDFASYSFDVAVHNIFATLVAGGCLCIPSDIDRKYRLAESIRASGANIVNLTASVSRLIEPDTVPNLKTLLFLGEAVTRNDIERWWGKVRVINTYGPAECTPISTINLTGTTPSEASEIGKGVGVLTWVVDPENHDHLTSYGEIGELLLEGPVLARGYLQNPKQTAAAFIQDPAWLLRGTASCPGRNGRLYKTGDLVRYNENGGLIFIGRKDTQVKIRGQRVELGEVEYHVQKSLAVVSHVVAEVIEIGSEKSRAVLVAFLEVGEDAGSPNEDGSPRNSWYSSRTTSEAPSRRSSQDTDTVDSCVTSRASMDTKYTISDTSSYPEASTSPPEPRITEVLPADEMEISNRLPPYMVPAVYFRIAKIPLSPTGKANRKLLREVGSNLLSQSETFLPATQHQSLTDAQLHLRRLWALVLDISEETISLECNFFKLGADSISVIKLVGAARREGLVLSVENILEHPTLTAQAEVSGLAERQGPDSLPPFSLLDMRSEEDIVRLRQEISALCSIEEFSIEDAYPCTPLQEGFMALNSKRTGDYVLQNVLELSENVDLNTLWEAWDKTVKSVPILRTRIIQHDQLNMVQVVCKQRTEIHEERAERLENYLKKDKLLSMDTGERLSRFAIIKDGTTTQPRWFVWTVHHALVDGWSIPLVLESFNNEYQELTTNSGARPEFSSFVKYINSTSSEDSETYWRSYLGNGGYTPFPALPSSNKEVVANTVIEYEQLLPKRTDKIDKDMEITTTTLVRAALAIMIGSQTGQKDVIFGTTLSGRNTSIPGIENMIASTIATVPIRVELQSGKTILDMLNHLQRQAIEMIPYEQTGLQKIAKIDEDSRTACDFQTLVVVQPQDVELQTESACGIWQSSYEQQIPTTYAITLECILQTHGIKIRANFDSTIVPKWRMERMLQQFGTLLERISNAQVGQRIDEIDNLTSQDESLVWEWNRVVPTVIDRSIHGMIIERVNNKPEAAALCGDGQQQTYRDLDAHSTRLAHHLVHLGVGPNTIVPLVFEKSIWTVVAMLGVLKAGGAFTPLDPGHAGERRRTILEKTLASLILGSSTYANISLAPGCFFFEVNGSSMLSLPEVPLHASLPEVSPSSAAYIIFTSGSTGEPKGVILEHNAVTTSSCSYGPRIGISESSRVLQFASYTFDASILEIISTLILGGCVCVPSETERTTNISAAINKMGVNFTLLTPTVARMIQPKDVPGLHTLVLGGEAVARSDYDLWSSLPNLVNAYGPTECAVCSVAGRLNGGKTRNDSMGTPVGCVGWVVNPTDHSRLVPVGAVGELLLEGPILARGYLDDIGKTTAAFVESPPWLLPERSSRLYKTGDLVRYNQDGSLSFVSRKDTQVKISGQRMELGEIEHHLRECIPFATQVVAEVVKPCGLDSGMLAAFVELHERTQSEKLPLLGLSQEVEGLEIVRTHTTLHAELSKRLPTYMIPRIYLRLPQIPLSPSGKIDRQKLRHLALGLSAQEIADAQSSEINKKRQPQTISEQKLCNLWSEVLGLKPSTIGLDDSFFRLGGDSVVAMKLVAAARREGISITVADVFRQPSLGSQAGLIQGAQVEEKLETVAPFQLFRNLTDENIPRLQSELSALCGVESSRIEDAYQCTPLQEGLISLTAKRDGSYILQMVLDLVENINIDALRAGLECMSQEIAVLRTRIVEHSSLGLVQVVCRESITWAEVQGIELEDFLQKDNLIPMGLGNVLSRFSLVSDESGQPHSLVWTVHHALYDGWSLPLMLDLVNEFYQRPIIGKQPGFNTFVKYIAETKDHDLETFWQSYLADSQCPAIAAINNVDDPMADTTLEYEQTLPAGWKSRHTEATTSTLVRAAMAILISRHTGTNDVNFGATVSGRHAPVPKIEQIAGPTIATVPVRIKVEKEKLVLDYIKEVQEGILQMIPHEQMGLQRIAKLSEAAQLACDFQILLVVQPTENTHQHHQVGQWQLISSQKGFSTYPLTVECILEEGSVKFKGTFDSRVAEKWKVDMMLSQLGSILGQLADAEPSQKLENINTLMHDKELLFKWNESIPEAVEKCIHELVDDHVQRQPKAPAVCSWDGELTYGELDRLSTQLASHLASIVKPETFVPLCFEKSMWTIVSMLAVLKAGAAFVLLDPGLPQGRLQLICRKIKAVIALTSVTHHSRLVNIVPQVLSIGPGITQLIPAVLQPPKVKPTNVAYIIFTSGSTGTPKGCIIEHRSYATAALSHGSDIEFSATTRALQYGSYIFAGAIMEILMTLINGGCVCVLSDEERGGSRLAQAIRRLDANWAFLTSSVLAFLKPEEVPSLRTICIGGEAIRGSQIRQWAPHVHLRQTYGSAETSAVASLARLTESTAPTEVGRAVTSRFWIVDPGDMNRLMPIGAAGELVVEGAVIGRGYLDDPEKTAAAFIPPPAWASAFGVLKNQKMLQFYRTGDIAAYKSDGSIELLGRKDMQVKLQGQRIELGEIEHQIRLATTEVSEAAVEFALPNKQEGRNKAMLVGFIVWRKDQDGQTNSSSSGHDKNDWKGSALRKIQSSLAKVLPYFMVPSLLINLPELPYTASKKVDRKKLREIGYNITADQMTELQKGLAGEKRAPRTLKEKRLQHLWARVLDIDKSDIGLNDNFFQLGGDSVTAMRLVGAARKAGIAMTVADIFRQPILSAQAKQQENPRTAISNENIPAFLLLIGPEGKDSILEELADLCNVNAALIEDAYPCTPLQEGLLSLTAKRSGDYTLQNVFDIPESVHVDNLKVAWQTVVTQTPILRTRIVNTSLGMVQVVCKEDIDWVEADDLDNYLVSDQAESMELGKRLCRFAFVNRSSDSPKFVWTIHHGVYDGWSLPLILNLVSKAYRGVSVPKSAGFNAFIKQATQVKDSEAFWQPYLENGDFEPFPNVPPHIPGPVADNLVDYHQKLIAPAKGAGLRSTATISTLVRAALGIVIGRHTGSTDVVFGTIASGRNTEVSGIEEIIGPTIGTVPIRIQIPARETAVSDFLEATQSQATDMILYEQTGLPKISQISEDTRRACGFQTLLDIQSGSSRTQSDDTFLGKWSSPSDQRGFATYALTIECIIDSNSNFNVKASFDSRVLDKWVVERLVEQLGTVLERLMSAQSGQTLGDIDTISLSEASTIWEWNKTVPDPVDICVPNLIQKHVQRQPMAPAICAWDGELTFKDLDNLSSQLAGYLATVEVGPEVIVPLCFEKSLWTIVAMLGVLKAGGAFVCLDPSNAAKDRRRHILEECSARVVLTSKLFSTIELPSDCSPIVFGRDVVMSLANPQQDVTPTSMNAKSPAYLIFTSGSTGKPKGVVVEHSAISTSCLNHGQKLGFGQNSRVLQFSSYTFDACILEIFTTLVHGGCVCVPDEDQRLGDLSGAINALKANTLMLTPTVARTIEPDSVKTVTTLFLGGEASLQSDFERWSGLPSLLIAYGPTECAVCTMVGAIKPGMKVGTIGSAVGCTSWIVDPTDHTRLSPLGAIGELLLEGPVLAREYLHDPEKTSAAFLKNPDWLVTGHKLSGHPGRNNRLYKTGDLVRYLEDGSITFLGRKDTQAKIRGQRIELAEVEHHVQDCVVGAKQVVAEVITPAGDNSRAVLTVFMEIRTGARKAQEDPDSSSSVQTRSAANGIDVIFIDPEEKAAISRKIPAYMMPALYIQVPRIPLSSSGKADRKKLREEMSQFSAQQLADLMAAPEAAIRKRHPVTEAQRRISSLWAEVLNIDVDSIGLDDTFLGLGGNSIGAMKLAAVARQAGLSLTVSEIFRHPLLEDLASHTETRIPELQNVSTPEPYALLDPSTKDRIMQHLASPSRVTMEEVVDVLPVTAFQEDTLQQSLQWPRQSFNYFFLDFEHDLDVARLKQSCQTVLRQYPLLRSTFINSGGRFWQVVHKDLPLPVRIIDAKESIESASNSLCCADTKKNSFQPGHPATSFMLVRSTDQRCRIILRLSHAQYDGISLPIVIGTLLDSYQGSSIPSHADFSIFLNYARHREDISIKYWRRILDGSQITQVVPCLASSLAGTENLTQQPQKIVLEDVVNIPELPEKITLATLVNSAWAIVLSAITRQEDVVYGATVTGRNAEIPFIKDIVGPCMNLVPIRAQLSGHQTTYGLMRSIQEQYHLIGPADSLGLDKIIEHSTNWAPGSKFDFFFQHQGIEEHSQYGFEGSHTKLTGFSNPSFVPPVLGTVSYPTKAGVRIQVLANTHIATDTKVAALLDSVCKTVSRLAADKDATLASFKPDISRIISGCQN